MKKSLLTRGEFWHLGSTAGTLYEDLGLTKGERVIHGFSCNSPCDLVFRLAGTLSGIVPVTINWQSDDLERISGKVALTGARLFLYDGGMEHNIASLKQDHAEVIFFPAEELEYR